MKTFKRKTFFRGNCSLAHKGAGPPNSKITSGDDTPIAAKPGRIAGTGADQKPNI